MISSDQNHLPSGWTKANLAAITEPRSGKVDPQASPSAQFIGMEQIETHTMRLVGTVPAKTMKSAANRFEPGDVLYGRLRPYLNKVYQPDFSGLCSGEFIVLAESPAVSGRFLKYRLNSADFVRFASRLNTGDRPRVDFDQISGFEILLPPPKEQLRIADAVEELLSDLDAGVEALGRIQTKLGQYRAAVLKAAVEGRLTELWRRQHPDVEPASELLRRILLERSQRWEKDQLRKFTENGKEPPKNWRAKYKEPVAPKIVGLPPLPEHWCWTTVDQCRSLLQYGTSAKCGSDPSGIPVLRMGNILQDGRVDLAELKYLPRNHPEFPGLLLEEGNLVFNRTNSPELVGKTAIYRGVPKPCSFASYLIRVRLLSGVLSGTVANALNSYHGRRWIKTVVNQTVGQANVNGSKLAAFTFPLPPLLEQESILEAVEDQLSVIEHLEVDVEAKLTAAQTLRQAILRHAFTGQLVPQDRSDEPVAELLRRIATGRLERERSETEARHLRVKSKRLRKRAETVMKER